MDALFGRINVRDLLSTHDLTDPTAPLSAPDLRLLISRLESHSLQIKSKVQSYLLSHKDDFATLFSLCNDAVSRTDRISVDLEDILRLVSDRQVDAEVRLVVEELREKTREARVKKEALEIVRVVVAIEERLKGVREGVKNGQLGFAAQEVRELKKALRIGDEDEKEPIVYGLLRQEWHDCLEEIQELLVRFMKNAVQFEPEVNGVRVRYQLSADGNNGVDLRTVLEAMEVVGILDYGLAKVADLMMKHIVTPAVNYESPITIVEELNQGLGEMTDSLLKIVSSAEPKQNEMDGKIVYTRILQVIKFVYKYICLQNGSWVRCFGKLTWPRISELIISNFLSKVVPDDASKLPEFQKIVQHTSKFEAALKEIMFISASDNKDDRLSNFAENVEVHFASRKKTEILAKARNLLLQSDFAISHEYTKEGHLENSDGHSYDHVVDLIFSSERCVVSRAASQLMKLVHQTLKDVCLSTTRVALEFYRAARDAILLYESIIPVKLERQLNGINHIAALIHNDCLYLSQEILGLAFEYHLDFSSAIREQVVFADMAPRFHLMAEETLQRQIQLVIFDLRDAIDGTDGFQNTHQMQQFESAKFSMEQVVFILEKVHIIWEPLLLPSTYKKSMCTVLESVFSRVARDILFIDDMAAEETLHLQRLVHLTLENLSSLMESLNNVSKKGKSEKHQPRPLEDLIPSLLKIRKLAELLDMPLKSITAAWETGELVSCGFTVTEVVDFIKAIFTDSPLRKECLWRIQNVDL